MNMSKVEWMQQKKTTPELPRVLEMPSLKQKALETDVMPTKHHVRTTSVPVKLPSHHVPNRLSMDDLLEAIELEQHMYAAYKHQRGKSATRVQSGQRWSPYNDSRRRSRSAPGAPEASVIRHHTMASHASTRWTSSFGTTHPYRDDGAYLTTYMANSIVQQHIAHAKRQ